MKKRESLKKLQGRDGRTTRCGADINVQRGAEEVRKSMGPQFKYEEFRSIRGRHCSATKARREGTGPKLKDNGSSITAHLSIFFGPGFRHEDVGLAYPGGPICSASIRRFRLTPLGIRFHPTGGGGGGWGTRHRVLGWSTSRTTLILQLRGHL